MERLLFVLLFLLAALPASAQGFLGGGGGYNPYIQPAPMRSAFDPSGSFRYATPAPVVQPASWFNPAGLPTNTYVPVSIPVPNPARFDRYGNYCGPGHIGGYSDNGGCNTYWRAPIDSMDEACRDHDYEYTRLNATGRERPTRAIRNADDKLLESLRGEYYDREKHLRLGTYDNGREWYRRNAARLFNEKGRIPVRD